MNAVKLNNVDQISNYKQLDLLGKTDKELINLAVKLARAWGEVVGDSDFPEADQAEILSDRISEYYQELRLTRDGKVQTATVRWFDSYRGVGLIRLKNGESLSFNHTYIKGFDTNDRHAPTEGDKIRYEGLKGQAVTVTLYINHRNQVVLDQVELVK